MIASTNSERAARPPLRRWWIFLALGVAYLLIYFHRLCPAVVAVDLMTDLKAGAALMGVLASAYFYPYALMQLPCGLLTDSLGPRRIMSVSFVLAGLASIFFGLAGTARTAVLARVLVGLGVSVLFVPAVKVMTAWFSRTEFGPVLGGFFAVGGLGILAAGAPLGYLSQAVGWRLAFVAIGVFTLAWAVVMWFVVRDRPPESGPRPDAAEATPVRKIGLAEGLGLVLKTAAFWPLAIWFFFTNGIFFAFVGLWGGPYLQQVYGLSRPQAGQVLSMAALGVILGGPLVAYISEKVIHSRKKILVFCGLVMVGLTAVLAFSPAGLGWAALHLFFFLLGVFGSAVVAVAFTTTKELFPLEISGTATGLINLFPFFGGAVMQVVMGLILEAQGRVSGLYTAADYGRTFLVLFLAALVALAAAALTRDTYRPVQA